MQEKRGKKYEMQIESVCSIQAGGIKMEWIERLNKAMSYIEEHITEEIDFEQTAKIACCSAFTFRGCSRIWQASPSPNTSGADG